MNLLAKLLLWTLLSVLAGAGITQELLPAAFSFDPNSGISNRLITPNGDALNDRVVFSFNNPRDSDVSGRIYDIKGAEVAAMTAGTDTLIWDGKSGGQAAPSGVYIYVIRAEDKVYSGTLVVIQ